MIYDYNDIRNPNWFGRLSSQIGENRMRRVQATGSEANDPYFAAKAAQEQGDLSGAQSDAFRREREAAFVNWGINNQRNNANEAARQRTISNALARQWRPDQVLGVMGEGNGAGGAGFGGASGTDAPQTGLAGPGESMNVPAAESPAAYVPSAPREQRSAGAYRPYKTTPFNANMYIDPEIRKMNKRLQVLYANIASRPIY